MLYVWVRWWLSGCVCVCVYVDGIHSTLLQPHYSKTINRYKQTSHLSRNGLPFSVRSMLVLCQQ